MGYILNNEEIKWLKRCKENPIRYKIEVDNDDVFVTDRMDNECAFTFDNFGQDFIVQLLNTFDINADLV